MSARMYSCVAVCLCLLLSACTGARERALMSDWQPVHRFPPQSAPVPLVPIVEFRVTPVDATLRLLLSRWAYEAGLRADYRLPQDWTLHADAGSIRESTLQSAVSALSAAYGAQGVEIVVENQVLIARVTALAGLSQ